MIALVEFEIPALCIALGQKLSLSGKVLLPRQPVKNPAGQHRQKSQLRKASTVNVKIQSQQKQKSKFAYSDSFEYVEEKKNAENSLKSVKKRMKKAEDILSK